VISLLSRKVPTITQWLKEVLKDDEVVAADPTLGSDMVFLLIFNFSRIFIPFLAPIQFKPLLTNLIDVIWTTGRPPVNDKPGFVLHLNYSGKFEN
jgi:hypothetical protein